MTDLDGEARPPPARSGIIPGTRSRPPTRLRRRRAGPGRVERLASTTTGSGDAAPVGARVRHAAEAQHAAAGLRRAPARSACRPPRRSYVRPSRQKALGSRCTASGTGWRNSSDAFAHVTRRSRRRTEPGQLRTQPFLGVPATSSRRAGSRTRPGCCSMPITSRCRNADGSSIAQTQKLRRNMSAGLIAMSFHVPYIASYLRTCSSRSSRPATQPMPPSRQADPQLGEAHRDARVEPVDRGEHRVPEEQHADGVGRRVGRRRRRRARRADVQAHDGAGLFARGHQRIPVAGVQRRQPEQVRRLARTSSP